MTYANYTLPGRSGTLYREATQIEFIAEQLHQANAFTRAEAAAKRRGKKLSPSIRKFSWEGSES
jgi:hypothetical protein